MPSARPVATSRNAAFWSGKPWTFASGKSFLASCSPLEPCSAVIVLPLALSASTEVMLAASLDGDAEHERVRHVGAGEVDDLLALLGGREADRDHVELLGLQARDQAVEVEVLDVELGLERGRELVEQVDVIARGLAVLEVHLGLELEVHADGQLARVERLEAVRTPSRTSPRPTSPLSAVARRRRRSRRTRARRWPRTPPARRWSSLRTSHGLLQVVTPTRLTTASMRRRLRRVTIWATRPLGGLSMSFSIARKMKSMANATTTYSTAAPV